MSLIEPPFVIKHTSVSHPRLSHSHSKQSVTASEDYYSFSDDYASTVGDETEHLNSIRPYQTPPSRRRSPENGHENPQSEATLQSVKPVRSRQRLGVVQEREFRRKPVDSAAKEVALGEQKSLASHKRDTIEEKKDSKMDPISPSMTPGIDEMPYIRFAIDQLTRDEEVRGSRHYPANAEDDITRGLAEGSGAVESRRSAVDKDADRIEPIEGFNYTPFTPGQKQKQKEKEDMARQKEMQAGPAPTHPLQGQSSDSSMDSVVQYDVFVPYEPPTPSNRQPNLNFLPGILRPFWLITFIFLCILMLAGLIFSAIWSRKHNGLWAYGDFGDNRYFVFEYLPTMFGMIILIWLFQVQIAVQRISPFMAMASHSTTSRSEGSFLDLYPTQFLFPKFQHFRAGQPIIGTCFFVFWLFLFTIPLLASAFNVRNYGTVANGVWRWVAVQGVIWTVVALYILLVLALISLAFTLWRSTTGLKWDPRSIADIIALLERANIMNDYAETETFTHMNAFRQRLWNRTDRLGYWHTSRRPQDIFYGLGEEGGATRRYSVEQGRLREKAPARTRSTQQYDSQESLNEHDIEAAAPAAGPDYSIRSDIRSAAIRRRYMPWFLSSSSILAWILIAIVLLIAFYVVTFVNQASTRGFLPQISANTNTAGFSAANFLYSFIPALLGLLLYLLWLPLDFAHRRLAPFAAMSSPQGAVAEKSLLLDYTYALPLSVTLSAISNRHWKIALLSALSTINIAIPILSGGLFWAQWYPGAAAVRITAHPAGLYALCFFLALYTLILFALIPGRKTVALPHDARSLAEIISWLYMSPLLCDRAFARCETKAELVARLLGVRPDPDVVRKKPSFWTSVTNLLGASRPSQEQADGVEAGRPIVGTKGKERANPLGEATLLGTVDEKGNFNKRREVRYGFGVFVGRDGKEHLGVERLIRAGREMVVLEEARRGQRTSWIGF